MTIACCYVSAEGVVFGADSTVSFSMADGLHYLNHAQKVFEVGDGGTIGIVFWGLAALGGKSYRTLIAELQDSIESKPVTSMEELVARWIAVFHHAYEQALIGDQVFGAEIADCREIALMQPFDPDVDHVDGMRTPDQEDLLLRVRQNLTVGFAIGGRVLPDRTPLAYFMHFEPQSSEAPIPMPIPVNSYGFWGAPNIFQRLVFGADDATKQSILNSNKWTGSTADLDEVLAQHRLFHPILPLREVIDFVHTGIHSTIKALKFSHFSQVCGGPIELAVVSTDRQFRWVRHKNWDAAVVDGDIS